MRRLKFSTAMVQTLELLSPARNAEVGRVAILAGADAVYIGAPAFGARASAGNSVEDIASLCAFAHQFRAKVYVTMNTILFDNELASAQELAWQLYASGVDALIVQDMAYLMMDLPPIALHASTQCDIRTPEKARRLARSGFSQLVLPRELTIDEIKACVEAAAVPVEVFVHGALCVSYSGDCQSGFVSTGRSGNRGNCPQMCRLPYDLIDSVGNMVGSRKHYLSLRDMNRSANMAELVEAGVSSFKIEGRLKDAAYVANVTRAYSLILDDICAKSEGKYTRGAYGSSTAEFVPDLSKTFNRSYTTYFLSTPGAMASIDTPKWAGVALATVREAYNRRQRAFRISDGVRLNNGDGLGYFSADGEYHGFRLNKADGNTLYPASEPVGLSKGQTIYRNVDKAFMDILQSKDATCNRHLKVDFVLVPVDNTSFAINVSDERGCKATIMVPCPYQAANSSQQEQRRKILSKTGDTIYDIGSVDDGLGDCFIPASVLTHARREALKMLDAVAEATYRYDRRRHSELETEEFEGTTLTYHDNVANQLAREFYTSHGAVIESGALETEPRRGEIRVMQTRYCIRRELGACLKTKCARKLPSPLFLRNESGVYRLDFDCRRCGMDIVKVK